MGDEEKSHAPNGGDEAVIRVPRAFVGQWPTIVLGLLGAGSFGYGANSVGSRLDALTTKVDTRFTGLETSLTTLKEDVAIFKSQNTADRVAKLEQEVERLKTLMDERKPK